MEFELPTKIDATNRQMVVEFYDKHRNLVAAGAVEKRLNLIVMIGNGVEWELGVRIKGGRLQVRFVLGQTWNFGNDRN
jgi:hypothetical protein